VLRSYRNAWYFAIGIGGLGILVALCFLAGLVERRGDRLGM
jgi:hypothetical protein